MPPEQAPPPSPTTASSASESSLAEAPSFVLRSRTVALVLVVSAVSLSTASYAMHLITRATGADAIAALDVGDEVSFATWFQSTLFIAAALVLLLGARQARSVGAPTRGWHFLAAVMLALSLDEAVSIHERLGSNLREVLDTSGFFYYVWVFPALAFVLVVVAVELRWLMSFAPRTRNLLLLAGAVFVTGAAGFELLAGVGDESHGSGTLTSISLSMVEELLEMLGLSLFVVTLLDHLIDSRFRLHLTR